MHRDILETIAVLSRAADDDDGSFPMVLRRLHDQVLAHFEVEERLLDQHLDQVQVRTHAQDHANLLKLLTDAGQADYGSDHPARLALVRLLRNWLLMEIADNDGHMFSLTTTVPPR